MMIGVLVSQPVTVLQTVGLEIERCELSLSRKGSIELHPGKCRMLYIDK